MPFLQLVLSCTVSILCISTRYEQREDTEYQTDCFYATHDDNEPEQHACIAFPKISPMLRPRQHIRKR